MLSDIKAVRGLRTVGGLLLWITKLKVFVCFSFPLWSVRMWWRRSTVLLSSTPTCRSSCPSRTTALFHNNERWLKSLRYQRSPNFLFVNSSSTAPPRGLEYMFLHLFLGLKLHVLLYVQGHTSSWNIILLSSKDTLVCPTPQRLFVESR